jgi:hypothetical protein
MFVFRSLELRYQFKLPAIIAENFRIQKSWIMISIQATSYSCWEFSEHSSFSVSKLWKNKYLKVNHDRFILRPSDVITDDDPMYLSMALQPFGPLPLFQFLNIYAVGRTPLMGDQPVARPLPTHRTTQEQNKRTQASMPRVRFELTIPVFGRAKTVIP